MRSGSGREGEELHDKDVRFGFCLPDGLSLC